MKRAINLLALAALSGCGDPSERLLQAYDRLLSCQALPDPAPELVRRTQRERLSQTLRRALELPGSGMTLSQQSACAAALDRIPCDQLADLSSLSRVRECQPLGSLTTGQPCTESGQCASGQCSAVRVGRCGACLATQGVGQPCGGANPSCATGLWCLNSTCVPRLEVGAACAGANQPPCQPWLACYKNACAQVNVARRGEPCGMGFTACALGSTCRDGTCVSLVANGQACGEGVPCSAFSFCDFNTRRCVPTTFAGLGDRCGAMAQGVPCLEGYCSAQFQCEPLGGEGASCSSGAMCQPSAVCSAGSCQSLPTCGP